MAEIMQPNLVRQTTSTTDCNLSLQKIRKIQGLLTKEPNLSPIPFALECDRQCPLWSNIILSIQALRSSFNHSPGTGDKDARIQLAKREQRVNHPRSRPERASFVLEEKKKEKAHYYLSCLLVLVRREIPARNVNVQKMCFSFSWVNLEPVTSSVQSRWPKFGVAALIDEARGFIAFSHAKLRVF